MDRVGNSLLDRLPRDEWRDFQHALVPKRFASGATLYRGGLTQRFESIVFPTTCVTSMLAVMSDGDAAEAGTVGREGMVGATSVFGSVRLLERWIVQVPGEAYVVPVERLREFVAASDAMRSLLHTYVQSLVGSLAQSVACNALHLLVERCARWLLLTHDRAGRDEFELTQEFLATMLGVRRPGVSVAAASLHRAGAISYSRGVVRVENRAALEAAACECYFVTAREYERLFAENAVAHGPGGDRV